MANAATAGGAHAGVKRSRDAAKGEDESTNDEADLNRRGRSAAVDDGKPAPKSWSAQKPPKAAPVVKKARSASVDRGTAAAKKRSASDGSSDNDDNDANDAKKPKGPKTWKGRWYDGWVVKKGAPPTEEAPLPVGLVTKRKFRIGRLSSFEVTFEIAQKDGRIVYLASSGRPKCNVSAHSTHRLIEKLYKHYRVTVRDPMPPANIMMIMTAVLGESDRRNEKTKKKTDDVATRRSAAKDGDGKDDDDSSSSSSSGSDSNNSNGDGASSSSSSSGDSTVDGDDKAAATTKRAPTSKKITPTKAARIAVLKSKLEKVREAPPKLRSSESATSAAPKKTSATPSSSAMKREQTEVSPARGVHFSLPARESSSHAQTSSSSWTPASEPPISLNTPLIDALVMLSDKPREKVELWAEVLTRDDIDTVRDLCALPEQTFERLIALPTISILLQGLLLRLRLQHKV
jgi:hypothetical protein